MGDRLIKSTILLFRIKHYFRITTIINLHSNIIIRTIKHIIIRPFKLCTGHLPDYNDNNYYQHSKTPQRMLNDPCRISNGSGFNTVQWRGDIR